MRRVAKESDHKQINYQRQIIREEMAKELEPFTTRKPKYWDIVRSENENTFNGRREA